MFHSEMEANEKIHVEFILTYFVGNVSFNLFFTEMNLLAILTHTQKKEVVFVGMGGAGEGEFLNDVKNGFLGISLGALQSVEFFFYFYALMFFSILQGVLFFLRRE